MEQRYVLGLDIGIASVGWAALALNDKDEPYRILDLNSRIFPKAEVPKTGASLASARRTARGARRRLRRRRHRLERMRGFLVSEGVLTREAMLELYSQPVPDVYEIRYEGLQRRLTPEEWARVLLFFAKHRGFQSNRLAGEGTDEEGKVKEALKDNVELLVRYRTVGEMLYKDEKFQAHKRNKASDYQMTVSRAMLRDEIDKLFEIQRKQGNPYATLEFQKRYLAIFSAQRNFDEGPGGGSPYGGNLIENMIGLCTLERDAKEKRAPKASYSFMRFSLLQKLNHMKIKENGGRRGLTAEERQCLEKLAWKSPSLNYARLRKELELRDTELFNDLFYGQDIESTEKKASFNYTVAYHEIRKALDKVEKGYIQRLSSDELDIIGYAFSVFKHEENLQAYMKSHGIAEEVIRILLANLRPFRKFGHISVKACRKLMPYLEQGMVYYDACIAAGYKLSGEDGERRKYLSGYMEEVRDIPNPVVRRSISQTIKVLNAIIKRYGSPVEIHVELAREMARNFQERKQIQKQIDDNSKSNERIKQELIENGLLQPNGLDIVKWKLYKEQQGVCAYSQKPFDIGRLLHEGKYAEVDHILPYSRSFDDSYVNKVLVLTDENQHKGNRTPMEYMENDDKRLMTFTTWVESTIRDFRKRRNLLRKNYSSEEQDWKERHLNDTKYISRFVYNLLREHLIFNSFMTGRKRHVLAVNGAITAYVRKRLGISKIRENGDLHHAVDAAVIACVTQGMVNKVQEYSKAGEMWGHAKAEQFPEPWHGFRRELEARVGVKPAEKLRAMCVSNYTDDELQTVKPIFVSRMPQHKVRATAHEDTIHSPRLVNEGFSVQKTKLSKLRLTNDGMSVADYYNPSSDVLLYQAILKRLQAFQGDAKKAFAAPFYKPRADGSQGPLVRTIKTVKKTDAQVMINQGKGMADNGRMLRVDVFYRAEGKGKGYYLVPIYAADVVKPVLPLKAVVANKPYADWMEMKADEFIFSLYQNDLLLVRSEKGVDLSPVDKNSVLPKVKKQVALLYYQTTNRNTSAVTVINHDNTYGQGSMGIRNITEIKKMQIDVLGNITEAPQEVRRDFRRMKKDPHAKV
ncbi:CRISPR-associated endonuclease Csn1 [Selenomonas ruminantium]|uniref:CRISPR-associated endonuclease Cas9 n=1 Tax=Selenomonas ruminantium TaxID=971 RepID=A0A1M6ST31_SELRU|nr:type II CRISPR RNA-guided endonuclease Cas9 [Selenomonas ruminantium]SHK47835.1 CRISPR-associated endonuclease Csn1 [Selenomonas ruminantium]